MPTETLAQLASDPAYSKIEWLDVGDPERVSDVIAFVAVNAGAVDL